MRPPPCASVRPGIVADYAMATDEQMTLRENQETVSRHTRRQHDELLLAIHSLEAALSSPAPGREKQWAARARRELNTVRESLERHILSAEGNSGLFSELDMTRPCIAVRVEELRQEHRRLLDQARKLEQELEPNGAGHDFASLRADAAKFLSAIRRHHGWEVDLIYECFWLDIGVGD
jgi:hypothetical protein